MNRKRVVVVGAGVTGATAAYQVQKLRPEAEVVLLEQSARPGGNIVTEDQDGFVLDGGPDSFLRTKPQALQLCRELGLDGELIQVKDEGRAVYIAHQGRLELMPGGMALAVPTKIEPLLQSALLSPSGKLRMLGDLLLPAFHGQTHDDESIAEFVQRRFGREAAERLAGPMLGGIYAGDVTKLSLRSTFPQLIELERAHGSVVLGMFAAQSGKAKAPRTRQLPELLRWMRRNETAPNPFSSLRGGMTRLIRTLIERLPQGSLRTNTRPIAVRAPSERAGRWQVALDSGETLEAEAVLLATPAHASARLVPDARLSAELDAIPYLSTATVFFALPASDLARSLDGSGFVVPSSEGRLLAGTWISSKWENRAPAGHVLIRAFLGGARDPELVETTDDAGLVSLARSELERLMGPLGHPLFTRVFRYVNSNPQPVVGHAARLERISRAIARLPGLYVAGAAYDGVGIPDCIRQAREIAERIVQERC